MAPIIRPLIKSSFIGLMLTVSLPSKGEPTAQGFFDMVHSQAVFLEQCISRGFSAATDVHNSNIRKAEALGFTTHEFWNAVRKGARGEVYDLLQEKWVAVPIDQKWCRHVYAEQVKLQKTLSRY